MIDRCSDKSCHGVVGGVERLEGMSLNQIDQVYTKCKSCMTQKELDYCVSMLYLSNDSKGA